MLKILLSAVGGAPSVSFIKHFQSLNYQVIGMDVNPNAVGQFFCDEFHLSPYVHEKKKYITFLEGLDFDIFFPWLDEEHLLFSSASIPAELQAKVITSSPHSIKIATSKFSTYEFAKEHNILVANITKTAPAVIRKDFSRGSKELKIIHNNNDMIPFDPRVDLVQEFIQGMEYTVDVLRKDNFFFAVPRQRIQASNVSIVGKIDMNQEVIDFCKDITDILPFAGPINIQVIRSSVDNRIYLVEINPRLAGTAILSINAGFDILDIAIKQFLNQETSLPKNIKDGLMLHRYWEEIYV